MPAKYNRDAALPLRVPPVVREALDKVRKLAPARVPVTRNAAGVAALILGTAALERALRADPNAVSRVLAGEKVQTAPVGSAEDVAGIFTEIARVCRALNPGVEVTIVLRRGRTGAGNPGEEISEWERLNPWSISVEAGALGTERRGAHRVDRDIKTAATGMLEALVYLAKRDAERLAQVVVFTGNAQREGK